MAKYIVEFVSTFFLVLSVCCVVGTPSMGIVAPLAVGFILIALIYAGGPISAAHYNPAVTIAFLIRNKINKRDVVPYISAQFLGSILGAIIACQIFSKMGEAEIPRYELLPLICAEALGSFALVWVILMVATTSFSKGNEYYGLAIGSVVIGAAYIFGSYGSFACFNPAVAIGLWLDGWLQPEITALIIIVHFVSAIITVLVFNLCYSETSTFE